MTQLSSLIEAVACVGVVFVGHARIAAAATPDWEQLHAALSDVTRTSNEGVSLALLKQSPALKQIAENGSPDIWVEMSCQNRWPLVALAGFYCLQEHQSPLAFDAALHILLYRGKNDSLLLFAPVMEYLRKTDVSPERIQAFSAFMRTADQAERAKLVMMLAALPAEFLPEWFEKRPAGFASPTAEALALAEIYQKGKLTDKMKARLDEFAVIPGIPRLTFVTITTRRDAFFKESLIAVLQDPSLSDIEAVLPVDLEYVLRNVDVSQIKVSGSRRELLDKALARIKDRSRQ